MSYGTGKLRSRNFTKLTVTLSPQTLGATLPDPCPQQELCALSPCLQPWQHHVGVQARDVGGDTGTTHLALWGRTGCSHPIPLRHRQAPFQPAVRCSSGSGGFVLGPGRALAFCKAHICLQCEEPRVVTRQSPR